LIRHIQAKLAVNAGLSISYPGMVGYLRAGIVAALWMRILTHL